MNINYLNCILDITVQNLAILRHILSSFELKILYQVHYLHSYQIIKIKLMQHDNILI